MNPFEVERGSSPIILAFPHTGTHVPPDALERLNGDGRRLRDTDWHVHRLYDGLLPGATTVRATFHRYVIDANRDPAGASLYPGQNTTALVPATDFDGAPIWRDGAEPDEAEVADRIARFHAPYHAALAAEIMAWAPMLEWIDAAKAEPLRSVLRALLGRLASVAETLKDVP